MYDFKPYDSGDLSKEINLRNEIDILFNDDKKAHWVVYRRFDLSKPTTNFVEITHEAVQGEKYEFVDSLIPVRASVFPVARLGFDQETRYPMGMLQDGTMFFYVKSDLNPKTEDKIFEINYTGVKPTVIPPAAEFSASYNIHSVMPMRELEYGRTEYYILLCKISNTG